MHLSVPGRSLTVIALAVFACAVTAVPAAASTATFSGNTLTYTAASGEKNDLLVSKWEGNVRLTEKKAKIAAGSGCTAVSTKVVTCAGADTSTAVVIDLGDQADHVRLSYSPSYDLDNWGSSDVDGGDGSDVLRGGDAPDTIDGGQGNDYITGNFGDDHLVGGDGDDSLFDGFGDDLLEGGPGTDLLQGAFGNNTLIQD